MKGGRQYVKASECIRICSVPNSWNRCILSYSPAVFAGVVLRNRWDSLRGRIIRSRFLSPICGNSCKFGLIFQLGQYRTNRQESLTRDFSSEKGGKPQEYFVYFKVFLTHFWRKESVKIRRRICVVLPSAERTGQKQRNRPAPALWRIPHFRVPKGQTDHL